MTTNLQEDQVEPVPVLKPRVGSARFDWVMILLCSWLLGGVYIDGWAHNHFTIIDTFFTPWHAVLYSGFLAVALFLVLTLMRNLVKGYAWWSALPPGYGLSLLGVVVFGIGGIGDFFWHTLFGFDVELATLLSPTHLLLATGGFLIMSGPLRAVWLRLETPLKPRWFTQLPLLISFTFVLSALAFMTSFAHPFVTLPAISSYRSVVFGSYNVYLNDLLETWGVLSIVLQTGLLIGTLLVLIRRQQVPLGAFTLMFTISLSMASVLVGNYFLIPVAVLSGVATDVFYKLFKPSADHMGTLRLFAFIVPICLFSFYFLDLKLVKDVWWPLPIWLGSILMAGVVGLLLSYVFIPPLKSTEQPGLLPVADASLYAKRGEVALLLKEYRHALTDFERALELEPENEDIRAKRNEALSELAKQSQPLLASLQLSRRHMLVGLFGLIVAGGGLVVAGSLVLRRSRTGTAALLSSDSGPTVFYAYSPQATGSVPVLLHRADSVVDSVAWSPNGKIVASANADGTVQLWSATSKASTSPDTPLFTYRKHRKAVTDLAWSADGNYIASASEDGTAQIWNASTGVSVLTYRGHTGPVFAIVWSPDGNQVASAGADKTVQIWNASTGTLIHIYRGHIDSVVALAWSSDGKRLASASMKGIVRVWDASSVALISTFQVDESNGNTITIVWSPNGRYLASARRTLSVWDASTGTLLFLYQDMNTTYKGHPKGSTITSLAWSPNGKQMLSASDDGTVLIWDVATGTTLLFFAKQGQGIAGVSWLSGGKNIALMGGSGTIEVWDATTGDTLAQSKKPKMEVDIAVWSPDNRRVAVVDKYGQVQIWDAVKGTILFPPLSHLRGVQNIAWAPNGKQIVSSEGGIVQVWDATTGNVLFTSQAGDQYSTAGLAWAPNSEHFAFTSYQGVQVWDITRGELLLTYRGLTGSPELIFTVSWSPDGKRIASASGDGTVQVWLAFPA